MTSNRRKMRSNSLFLTSLLFFLILWHPNINATVGYFALGFGPKSSGMAGATVAAPQSAMAGAINPAGMALVGERADLSVRAFSPSRDASLHTSTLSGNFDVDDKSAKTWFFIPGAGITKQISENLWFGLTAYGNGGMNTSYSTNIYDQSSVILGAFASAGGGAAGVSAAANVPSGTGTGTPNTGELGVDLMQMIIAPTLSFKIHPKHSIGVSALLAAQLFEAKGLGNFQCFTPTGSASNTAACSPGGFGAATPGFIRSKQLTDNGRDWAYGIGARIGWIGEIHPKVTLGGALTSKIYMTEFDDYSELFAEKGGFDIPAQLQVGIAIKPIEPVQLTFDYQRIFYGDVKSIANSGPVVSAFGPSIPQGSGKLGHKNGLGFGWKDINVYRFGALFNVNEQWTLRAGYSWNDSPIPNNELLFNIIAPAVITRHATVGVTYSPSKLGEWNLTYVHGFNEDQKQSTSAFGVPASIRMKQNSIAIGYSWKF